MLDVKTTRVIDISRYLADPQKAETECRQIAWALENLGVVVIRDPRLPVKLNSRFQRMMEQYFRQSEMVKKLDERLDLGHQVGWTPSFEERPKNRSGIIAGFHPNHRPYRIIGKDPKERFFIPVGERPPHTKYSRLNAPPVIPTSFPQWEKVTGEWSASMLQAIMTVCEMTAVGFGVQPNLFTKRMRYGPHLLAPTGSDLKKYGRPGTVLAGFHDDLNLLTGHGQANFPGLFAWTRQGERFAVEVPDGCLLMQAGQQMEYLTGGRVLCGLHEVVVTPEMQTAIQSALQKGETPWRVTSTLFAHISSDEILEPLSLFKSGEAGGKFPPMEAGEQVAREIRLLELDSTIAPAGQNQNWLQKAFDKLKTFIKNIFQNYLV